MGIFGIHTFAFAQEWIPDQIAKEIPALQELGIRLIEIPLLRPQDIDIAGTLRVKQETGIEVSCSLGLPGNLDVVSRPDDVIAFLDEALDVAAAVGAECLSGVTYGTIGKITGHPPTQNELDAVCRIIERGGAAAKARGLKLGVEPCNRYETHLMNNAADAVALIERSGADNVFIHLDTYHMNIEEASMEDGFRVAAGLLGYVHLSESNRGVPGTGTIDWQSAFSGLAQIQFAGPVVLESFNQMHPDIAGALAVWKPVATRPDDVVEVGLPYLRAAAGDAGYPL